MVALLRHQIPKHAHAALTISQVEARARTQRCLECPQLSGDTRHPIQSPEAIHVPEGVEAAVADHKAVMVRLGLRRSLGLHRLAYRSIPLKIDT
jgi:hypothetical protein